MWRTTADPSAGGRVQPGLRTVQGVLEEALALLIRRPIRVTVAGRTDAGVHARGQVVHLDLSEAEWLGLNRGAELDPAVALLRRIRGALSRGLGDLSGAIEVHRVSLAPEGFDARFSALWRRYSYRIADGPALWDPLGRASTLWHREPLDVGLLNEGAAPLLGLQDFRSYCKPREGATTIRELQRFEFARGTDGVIVATVQADAFCHNMVRSLVGSALYVGEGVEAPGWLYERLLARQRDAKLRAGSPAPAGARGSGLPDRERHAGPGRTDPGPARVRPTGVSASPARGWPRRRPGARRREARE